MLSLRTKLGFGLAVIGLPVVAYLIPSDRPVRSLAIGQPPIADAQAKTRPALPPGPVVMPMPAIYPLKPVPQPEPTVDDVEDALDALADVPFGQTADELAKNRADLMNWQNGATHPFGGIPVAFNFSGGNGGLSSVSASVPAGTGEKLKQRWGAGHRPSPGRIVWTSPRSNLRYEYYAPRPNPIAPTPPPRGEFRIQPQLPIGDLLAPATNNFTVAKADILGKNFEDVKKYLLATADGDSAATVALPPTEYSVEPTMATVHSDCHGTVEKVTLDLREDMQPGLAQKTRELLAQKLGEPTSVQDEDGVIVTTYASSPPVVTQEFGGGEMVRIEISRDNPALPSLLAVAHR